MRILALDLGAKRVGVAVSDELGITAQGLTVLERRPHAQFLADLTGLIQKYGCGKVVLGLPRNMNGSLGPEAQRALAMAHEIRKNLGVDVDTWDERMTTMAAERALLEADLSREKRKKVRDQVAAVLILQGYLDRRDLPPENPPC